MTRDKKIDVMKGILIVLVVAGHSGFQYTEFIYLFHMATFFMISGYLFNDKYTDSFKMMLKFMKAKIKTIWLPYFIWSVIFICANNLFIRIHIYSNTAIKNDVVTIPAATFYDLKDMIKLILRGFYFSARTEMGGTFWFFKTLFGVVMLYAVLDFMMKKTFRQERVREIIHSIVGIIFIVVGYLCTMNKKVLFGIPIILSIYLLYHIAVMIRRKKLMERMPKKTIIGIASFMILLICQRTGKITLNGNHYNNPVFLLIASLSGWSLIYILSEKIEKIKWLQWLSKVGKHSLSIMILHLISFKLVTLIQLAIYKEPIDYLAVYPVLHSDHGWWLAYAVIGVVIPLVAVYGYSKLILLYKKRFEKNWIRKLG